MGVIGVLIWIVGWFLGFKALVTMDNTESTGQMFLNAAIAFVFWIPIALVYVVYQLIRLIWSNVDTD